MPLTTKGRLYAILLVLAILGGGAYYVYREAGSFNVSAIWNRFVSDSAEAGGGKLGNSEVKAAIYEAILKSPDLRSLGIEVDVTDQSVTLKGNVESPIQRATLEQLTAGLAGTRAVNMTVGVRTATPAVPAAAQADLDTRLPKEVEFALYKSDAFEVKTLHVTSQNGVVHLTGTVRNAAEKLLAERIAREVPEVHGIQNDLEIPK